MRNELGVQQMLQAEHLRRQVQLHARDAASPPSSVCGHNSVHGEHGHSCGYIGSLVNERCGVTIGILRSLAKQQLWRMSSSHLRATMCCSRHAVSAQTLCHPPLTHGGVGERLKQGQLLQEVVDDVAAVLVRLPLAKPLRMPSIWSLYRSVVSAAHT